MLRECRSLVWLTNTITENLFYKILQVTVCTRNNYYKTKITKIILLCIHCTKHIIQYNSDSIVEFLCLSAVKV